MILQRTLPYDVDPRRLPGVRPLDMADWLIIDDAYAAQMARRETLLDTRRDAVYALHEGAGPAAQELLEMIVQNLPAGFERANDRVTCPDGRVVDLTAAPALIVAARLVQEDLCLMERRGPEHVLTGAVLCFPASWMLAEKIGRPLIGIHTPVAEYDDDLARRVQRLFNGVRAGHPLWRMNALWYGDPELHQPRSENDRRADAGATRGDFFRSERQSILRLPRTDAVAFTIHTFILARADAARAGIQEA